MWDALAAWQRTQSAWVPDVSAMARVLSDRSADACNIDRIDNWAMYGQEYIEDVQAMLAAAPAQPAVHDNGEVSDANCRRLLFAFGLECNTIGLMGAAENLHKGMKEVARAALAVSTGQEVGK